jgi:LPS export ABC transporter protein LptC
MRRTSFSLAAAGIVAIAACQDTQPPPVAATHGIADSADQVMFGAKFVLTTKGIQRGEMIADTMYALEEGTKFDARTAHVTFTTETGLPQGTMDAKRGVYSTRTQILEGWGDVVVKLVDGRMLKSPHVIYNQVTHIITGDTTYTLYRGNDTQHGIGFTANEAFTRFQCLRNCGGNFSVLVPEK